MSLGSPGLSADVESVFPVQDMDWGLVPKWFNQPSSPSLFCLHLGAAGCEDKGPTQSWNSMSPTLRPGRDSEQGCWTGRKGKDVGFWLLPTVCKGLWVGPSRLALGG